MSFSDFMSATKRETSAVEYVAASNLVDADGNPLVWKLKPLKTADVEALRKSKSRKTVDSKTGLVSMDLDRDGFEESLLVRTIAEPDLTNKELQDKFGCMDPIALLQRLVDIPGEYTALIGKINELTGYASPNINDLVNDAKN